MHVQASLRSYFCAVNTLAHVHAAAEVRSMRLKTRPLNVGDADVMSKGLLTRRRRSMRREEERQELQNERRDVLMSTASGCGPRGTRDPIPPAVHRRRSFSASARPESPHAGSTWEGGAINKTNNAPASRLASAH